MIWIEILSRHHEVLSRHRCDDQATIGRAYDNDVVLDDPFVAPHHLRIIRDDSGILEAQDLGTVNGLVALDTNKRRAQIPLDGGRILRVGRTLLRVRTPDFAVAPERRAGPVVHTGPPIAALAIVVIALTGLTLWLNETREIQPSRYLLPVMGVALLVLVWTTAWTVMSRIFTGAAHFDRHLLTALGGLLAFYLFDEITDYGSFAFSSRALADYAYVGNWIILAGLCYAHLRVMGPRRVPVKLGTVAALALAAIGAQSLSRFDDTSLTGQQSYLQGLKPPMFRLKAPQTLDHFLGQTDALKSGLDKARLEPPGTRGWFDTDNEE